MTFFFLVLNFLFWKEKFCKQKNQGAAFVPSGEQPMTQFCKGREKKIRLKYSFRALKNGIYNINRVGSAANAVIAAC